MTSVLLLNILPGMILREDTAEQQGDYNREQMHWGIRREEALAYDWVVECVQTSRRE